MIYQEMVLSPTINELIEMEYLVPVEYYAPTKPDLEGLKIRCGDYVEEGLAERMDRPQIVGDIVENWARICPDRKTVVFSTGVRHSIHIRDRFQDAGIAVEHIDGKTPKDERDEILRRLASGALQVVTNCMVLTEGWDCPSVSCCILARPTKSLGLYIQMAGRILRPYADKDNAIIIDHAGAVYEHGFIDDPREWSLDPGEKIQERERKLKTKDKQPITCEKCKCVYKNQPDCPMCGHIPVQKGESFDFVDGQLGRIKRDGDIVKHEFTQYQKEMFWRELKYVQEKRGYKLGWIDYKYKERFGIWPRNMSGEPIEPSLETKAWIRKQAVNYARQ